MAKKKRFDIDGIKRDKGFNIAFAREIQKYLERIRLTKMKHIFMRISIRLFV